jgi:hypothetical protein
VSAREFEQTQPGGFSSVNPAISRREVVANIKAFRQSILPFAKKSAWLRNRWWRISKTGLLGPSQQEQGQ